jgi:D-3-phosphoglycerate dehydrogenase / 2-oxoglutarate reductase
LTLNTDKTAIKKPLVLCAADLANVPAARGILDNACRVVYAPARPDTLQEHLLAAEGYYASLHVRLTRELIQLAPYLRAITTPSTGLDHIDLQAAKERNIAVLSLKDDRELLDRITATAELTWALLLACARKLPAAFDAAKQGVWARDQFRGHQLFGKTLGILGCGRLGSMVARYGRAFGLHVIACDLKPVTLENVPQISFDELLQQSDILSIHIHLTEENRNLINAAAFQKMKDGVILLNTSRGAIIDEAAFLDALHSGKVGAAGVDVIEGEWRQDLIRHPLIQYARDHDNLVITPHIGGVTWESQEMAFVAAAQKLVDFLVRQKPIT